MMRPLPFEPAPLLDIPFDHEMAQLEMGRRKVVKREFSSDATLDALRALGWPLRVSEGSYAVAADSADVHHGEGAHYTVFLGQEVDITRALAAETLEREARGEARREAIATLGDLLGYPACCTEAYLTQQDQGESASFRRVFEVGPLQGAPRWNNLFVLSHALISHFPCTLGCSATATLAQETWEVLADRDPERAEAVHRLLGSPITVWDRYRFLIEHPEHGTLTPNQIDGTPLLLAHPPLVAFVSERDHLPTGGTRLQFT